jgi:hypothetical protein
MAGIVEQVYSARMARVRNRLGLHLAVIFADSAQPLRALLDAARRAQTVPRRTDRLRVSSAVHEFRVDPLIGGSVPRRTQVEFERNPGWSVPTAYDFTTEVEMKNPKPNWGQRGITPDDYFSYFETDAGLRHATELEAGQHVQVERSTFDFEFLDSASRRFEISYEDHSGNRRRTPGELEHRSHRPIALERLHELRAISNLLTERLATRPMKILEGLLAAKQRDWGMERENVPAEFVRNVLANLELLPDRPPFVDSERDWLVRAFHDGLLQDALEIHFGVEKGSEEDK